MLKSALYKIIQKRKTSMLLVGVFFILALLGCASVEKKKDSIRVYTDVSFKSIIEQELAIFNTKFESKQSTRIVYKPESECFKAFFSDSADMIIASRDLSAKEKEYLKSQKRIVPSSNLLAYDAIAFVLPAGRKIKFTQKDIRRMLTSSDWQILIEGVRSSSTLLYLMEKMNLRAEDISPRLFGSKTAADIIKFIKESPRALGIVGISAIEELDTDEANNFSNGIQVAEIESADGSEFLKPYQANIYNGRYPFIRPIYFIVRETESGPGLRFGRFMSNEIGQLIFKRARYAPARMNFGTRTILLK